ncbi:hypothetical protein FG386_003110 [Cryptosporidium ryanae]|uniref:uncharacterized protein n=1 Tax=Cryptosporidium ryanae TaxID=515981 RepID=UPI00351A7E34|nr:hypothetical protein FG386_003110 [Cryptosporidium ryanae]
MKFSLFVWFKTLLVPKGSFGDGPNSKVTETVALIVITSLLSLGLYWALIFFFIFLKTGQLTNISTTIALYSRLEVPSMAICSLPDVSSKESIIKAYTNKRLKVILIYKILNKNYYSFYPKIRHCSWDDSRETSGNANKNNGKENHCLCIDMWKQAFYEKNGNEILKPPFFLFHRSPMFGFDLDSISVGIKYLKPRASFNSVDNGEASIIGNILKIGIYDHPMMVASQYSDSVEPSWFYSNIGNTAQVSLKLLKNYVFDFEKFYFSIFKGYVSRQENEYEIVVSQKNTNNRILKIISSDEKNTGKSTSISTPSWIELMNKNRSVQNGKKENERVSSPLNKETYNKIEFETASFTKFQFTFRDFSVTEVFRLSGASVVASFLTLMVVCISAFNKQLIYELLFPYYEDQNAKMTVTFLATFLSLGYVKKYKED